MGVFRNLSHSLMLSYLTEAQLFYTSSLAGGSYFLNFKQQQQTYTAYSTEVHRVYCESDN